MKKFPLYFSIFALTFATLTLYDTLTHSTSVEKVVSREKYSVRHYYNGTVVDYQAKDLWLYGGAMTIKRANDKDTVLIGGTIIANEN